MRKQLDSFEKLLRRMVEGSFERVLRRKMGVQDLVAELYKVIVSEARQGRFLTQFVVRLHAVDYARLHHAQVELPAFLESEVTKLLRRVGLRMPASLEITLKKTDDIELHTVKIEGEEHIESTETTQTLQAIRPTITPQDEIAKLDAFLIVNGKLHIELEKPTITIGRGAKNDIMLPSPKISRRHAQIRWRYGKFVLYDLGSRAGTFVNNNPVRETVLAIGDVLTLADATLIYGEGLAETGRQTPVAKPYLGASTLSMPAVPPSEE